MSWEQRPYSHGSEYDGAPSGGLRSWVSGFPPISKAVKWIVIANVVMFVLCQATGGYRSPVYQWLLMNTIDVKHLQIWRLFTFTYLHDQSSLMHVFLNMLGLYFLGVPLEQSWGSKRFFLFYTLGGGIAVLMYLLVTLVGWLDPNGQLVGASGGVFAVMGACAVLFPQFRLIFILFPVPIRTATMVFTAFFLFNLYHRGDNAGGDACHLAGLAFGVYWGYRGSGVMQRFGQWRQATKQGAWEAQRQRTLDIEVEVDRILEKVKRDGIQSLTRGEKKMLEEATRRKQGING